MRLKPEDVKNLPNYTVILNPLMAPNNGGNTFPSQKNAVLVVGPAGKLDIETTIAHEFMHQPVNYLLIDFKMSSNKGISFTGPRIEKAFKDSKCAMNKVKENWGYVAWWSYSMEALIRAASNRMLGQKNVESSFLFQDDFSRFLENYESHNKESFTDFIAFSLEKLKKQYCN